MFGVALVDLGEQASALARTRTWAGSLRIGEAGELERLGRLGRRQDIDHVHLMLLCLAALEVNVRRLIRVEPTMRVLHNNVLDKEHDHRRNEKEDEDGFHPPALLAKAFGRLRQHHKQRHANKEACDGAEHEWTRTPPKTAVEAAISMLASMLASDPVSIASHVGCRCPSAAREDDTSSTLSHRMKLPF
eukprot:scaffold56327_cov68-Phaeocystis_antarctica.AAC.9